MSPVPPATGASKIVFEPLKADELNHDWVTLTRCMTIFEADAIAMRLRAAEIPVFIPDEFLMQGISFNTITYGMVRVQVPPSQYQEACDVLQD